MSAYHEASRQPGGFLHSRAFRLHGGVASGLLCAKLVAAN